MLFYGMDRDQVLDGLSSPQAELLLLVARDEEDRRLRMLVYAFHAPQEVMKLPRPGASKGAPPAPRSTKQKAEAMVKLAMALNPKGGKEVARKVTMRAKAYELVTKHGKL